MVTICVMPKSTTHARRGEAKRAGMFLRNFHIEGHCGRASESRAPFAENGWDKERQPETRRSVPATVLRDQGSPIGENGSVRESGLPAAPSHGNAAVAKGCPPCDLVTKSVAADRVEDAPRDGVLASATEMMGLCDDAFTGLAFLYALDILCTKRGRPTVVQTTRALRPNDSWPLGRRPRYRPSVT